MARRAFANGTTVRARIKFKDPDTKVLTDPLSVNVLVRQPSGTSSSYVYGVDAALVKQGTGIYYIFVTLSEVGTYKWKWTGNMVLKSVVIYDECDSEKEAGFS